MNPPVSTAKMSAAQSAAKPIVSKKVKKRGDVGKQNNGKTTGFSAVAKNASKEYGSKATGQRVAGAVYAKMRASGKI